MLPFVSVDPHRGETGVGRRGGSSRSTAFRGFKFHPTCRRFFPDDRMATRSTRLIAEYKLPAIFHSGQSGIGSGHAAAAAACG